MKAVPRNPFVALLLATLAGCIGLPTEFPRDSVVALAPATGGTIARLLGAGAAAPSRFLDIQSNADAMRWRLSLADTAWRSIEAQYYLWHNDDAGSLLMSRLLAAADRGVRVRLLVDDINNEGADWDLATIGMHPRIEVRLFNPFETRMPMPPLRWIEWMLHMDRLNHRMHNKLYVVDNTAAIVGGRNIGDEYAGIDPQLNFRDLDILAVGPVVPHVSATFYTFWNSAWSFPVEAFVKPGPTQTDLRALRARLQATVQGEARRLAAFRTTPASSRRWLSEHERALTPGCAQVLFDSPPVDSGIAPVQIAMRLRGITARATRDILIVSAYLIPVTDLLDGLANATARGLRVRILTNSLASTDVIVANTGYKRYRHRFLDAGVELFEMRADAGVRRLIDTPPVHAAQTSLHAKAMVLDEHQVFIGTFNLDPRSTNLNTEVGLLIDSPVLARRIAAGFAEDLAGSNSWRVTQAPDDSLRWDSSAGRRYTQPGGNLLRRLTDFLLTPLPLEDQL